MGRAPIVLQDVVFDREMNGGTKLGIHCAVRHTGGNGEENQKRILRIEYQACFFVQELACC